MSSERKRVSIKSFKSLGGHRHPALGACRRLAAIVALGAATTACDNGSAARGAAAPAPSDYPATVDIPAQTITEGFATGTIRQSQDVDAFKITKSPVTVGQFRRCVTAGACSEPSANVCTTSGGGLLGGPDYAPPASAALPVTCVGSVQAEAFWPWPQGRRAFRTN